MQHENLTVEVSTELKGYQISADAATNISRQLSDPIVEITTLTPKAYDIIVEDASQIDKMEAAKELRLQIKNWRVDLDKRRKSVKEDALNMSKAIDGLAGIYRKRAEEAEAYLLLQERFVEILQEKAQKELAEKRTKELLKFEIEEENIAAYRLGELPEASYVMLKNGLEKAYNERIEAEKAAEREAEIKAEHERIYQSRRDELAKFAQFGAFDELQVGMSDGEYASIIYRMQQKKKQWDLEQEQIRKQNEQLQAEREKERKEREKLEAKLAAQKEAERKAKEEADRKAKEEAAEKQRIEKEEKEKAIKAEQAPDKDKLIAFIDSLAATRLPDVKSQAAKDIVEFASEKIRTFYFDLKTQIDKL